MKKILLFCVIFCIMLMQNTVFAEEELYVKYGEEIKNGCVGEYDLIRPFGYTQWWNHWGYVNACGEIIVDYYYEAANDFSDGLGLIFEDGGLLGMSKKGMFVDNKGTIVISSNDWDCQGEFHDGLARVKDVLSQGFINKKGEMVISADDYGSAHDFSEGIAIAQKKVTPPYGFDTYLTAIDTSGNELFKIPEDIKATSDFHEGRLLVGNNNYSDKPGKPLGYLNIDGDLVIKRIYEDARDFSEGLAAVQSHGWWGFIDKDGNSITGFDYEYVGDFHEGFARVRKDKFWGLIDKKGKEILPCEYSSLSDVSEGVLRIINSYKNRSESVYDFIYMDMNTKKIIRTFKDISFGGDFHDGLAVIVENTNKRYVINKQGTTLFEFPDGFWLNHRTESPFVVSVLRDWDTCDYFENGMVMVRNPETNEYGFINVLGEYHRLFIKPEYDSK